MEKIISAAEVRRKFSGVLREVREGRAFMITSHGTPVARIVPIKSKQSRVGDLPAWSRLLRRTRKQAVRNIGQWKRAELYG
jgi:prevent-host-death family protein